ncbi:putative disease resistance protein RGA3 [Senna tora]|uniref:Putative disease resistance protein RGA3 n=1 Tax=Senna tora TaxID=362788 RepID=A0A834W5I3_9FABA|nr:putative disease resistance protein RGA3 [Senna tora]
MAEAVLEVSLENLSSLIQNELGLILGINQEMKRLSKTLTTIKPMLEDAEKNQLTDISLKNWLNKLKDAVHLLDDTLDECSTEALEFESQGLLCESSDKVQCSFLSYFHPKLVWFRYKIAKKMIGIEERLDEILKESMKFHLLEMVNERRNNEVMKWCHTSSINNRPQVYGRKEDTEKIVDFFVGHASDYEGLSVYPIVGIGGLGKTTLAQLVFNHERLVNHFDLRIWVCASDFSLKRMLKVIIESSFEYTTCQDLDLESLQKRVQDILRRRRYLLVLDNVRNDDQDNWDRLKHILSCGSKGASILVTTHLTKVASIMGTVPPHELSILSEDDCWELFKQRAFEPNKGERVDLVAIGKEIVNKCRGVPLAVETLASLLRFKSEEKDWLYVLESKLWSLPQNESSIMPALRLSYLDLPVKLRQCFAFCALFPKDEVISKQYIIELWMSNGFISSNEMLEVEDIGDDVWNGLYWRSFFQHVQTDKFGNILLFKMHDLIHDLAQSIMEEECSYITNDNGGTNVSERTRHLSFYGSKEVVGWDSMLLHQIKSLKTYITPIHYGDQYLTPHELLKCYSLRVLVFMGQEMLSPSIGNLKHLRYLNLSNGTFVLLPDSICTLWNLQILNLENCYLLTMLPANLKHLKALRHLYLDQCRSLFILAPEMGQLTSLRTLNVYIVEYRKGFQLEELGSLNLKGELQIKHLEKVTSVMDAKAANLMNKNLNNLWLSWETNEGSRLQGNAEQILEVLQPHTQLKTLSVIGYMGVQFPQWMGSPTFKDLYSIELVHCKYCLSLQLLAKLPSLRKLGLSNMNKVQYIDEESYDDGVARGFKALEYLRLGNLPNLIGLSKEDGQSQNMFLHLSTLEISGCPKLNTLPCLRSVTFLRITGESNHSLLGSICNLHNLKTLWLFYNEELTSFPNGMLVGLTCLKEIHIFNHTKLEALPNELMSLHALEELHIVQCYRLEPLTHEALQGLHSLKRLKVSWYPKFRLCSAFQNLTSLVDLRISTCPKVEGFPEALQHITTLQSLSLYDLQNLASLPDWLGSLTSLKSLFISDCPKLMSLPISIQCLGNLKNLEIYGCPKLLKRCEEETGEDWHKIAHVPRFRMESRVVVRSELNDTNFCHLQRSILIPSPISFAMKNLHVDSEGLKIASLQDILWNSNMKILLSGASCLVSEDFTLLAPSFMFS